MVTFLSGGTGTPKLLSGVIGNEDIIVVGNTGDDIEMGNMIICPDLDTVMYLFSGLLDRKKWWGMENDTFKTHKLLTEFAEKSGWNGEPQFLPEEDQMRGRKIARWRRFSRDSEFMKIGDMDRAIHSFRSSRIDSGDNLTEITEKLCTMLGAEIELLPMSNDPISSMVITERGKMHFQSFWVGYKGKLKVKGVEYEGSEMAKPTEEVSNALKDKVIIGPSNPVTSIGPIRAINGIEKLLWKTKVVAVSPFIGDKTFSGPVKKLMESMGMRPDTSGFVDAYPFVDAFVIDKGDKTKIDRTVVKTDIRMNCRSDSIRVYEACCEALKNIDDNL